MSNAASKMKNPLSEPATPNTQNKNMTAIRRYRLWQVQPQRGMWKFAVEIFSPSISGAILLNNNIKILV
jgi:hypothetical protein